MGKKSKFLLFSIMIFVLLVGSVKGVRADIQLGDTLSTTGFARWWIGVHTGITNTNNKALGLQDENNKLQLSRGLLALEFTWTPFCNNKDNFKVFIKPRFSVDPTALWDDAINKYNAYPIKVEKNDWMMMRRSGHDWRAEIWELYADVRMGNFWLRAGKQQIVWGEMIGGRFLDQINPLDLSWNFNFEPEEFENIRIPLWMIRSSYLIPQHFLDELSIEGFVNPTDFVPQTTGAPGSPFNLVGAFPPFLRIVDDSYNDRRTQTQYGARIGWQKFGFYGTFCYMHLMNQSFQLKTLGYDGHIGPYIVQFLQKAYRFKDIYGMSLNYDIPYPWNLVLSFEGTWVPNEPYQDAKSSLFTGPISIKQCGTFNHALRLDHNHQVFPPRFLGVDWSFTAFLFQIQGSVREGDKNRIRGANLSRVEHSDLYLVGKITQPFCHGQWTPSFQVVRDIQHGTMYKPSIKYAPATAWYTDLTGIILKGGDKRPGRFGGMEWANEVFWRITYQW